MLDEWTVNCEHCTWNAKVKPSRRYIKKVGWESHAYDKKAHEMIFDHVKKMHKGMRVKIHSKDGYPEEAFVNGLDTSINEYVLENREWCRV